MLINDILFEASGLKSARPGETYTDTNGTEYRFVKWDYQHPIQGEQFPDTDTMLADIDQYTHNDPNKIIWINKPTTQSKSYAVAQFQTDDGKDLWIGKFFKSKNLGNTIFDKDAKQFAGITAGKAGQQASSAVKYDAQLKPKDLGLATTQPMTATQISATVAKHLQGKMLSAAVVEAATNKSIVFSDGAPIQAALQDDFCEVIAPVAILANHPVVTGDFKTAITDIFKGESLAGSKIVFPGGANNPLIDSYIVTPSGIEMGISSKGGLGGGAQATVTVAWKAKEQAKDTATGKAYIKKFKEASDFLDIIESNSKWTGPIVAARKYNLATPDEIVALEQLLKTPKNSWKQVTNNPAQDLSQVPEELKPMFREIKYNPGSYVPLLCLGAVARRVAKFVNDPANPMQFGEAVRSFLNSSAMVQAVSVVQTQNNSAIVKSINIMYPPNFKGIANLEPNSYAGTTIVTKFKVKMPKN
jgi:hypothetical protein